MKLYIYIIMQFVSFVEDLLNQQVDQWMVSFSCFELMIPLSISDMKHPSEFSRLSPSLREFLVIFFINLSWIFHLGQDMWDFFWISPHLYTCKVQFLSHFSPGRERTIGSSRPFIRWNRCGRGLWRLEKVNTWLQLLQKETSFFTIHL